jgi:prepilin-type processing-associated H-X9-DG protein
MDWATTQDNTNITYVKNGVLGPYTAGAVGIYQCPADHYLSPAQTRVGWSMRNRSNSMNALIGYSGDSGHDDRDGRAWYDTNYRQYLKQSDFRQPAMTWVTLDEHPDSINDAFFIVNATASQWGDTPASYHNGACGFSFADGHAEVHKWLSHTSKYPSVRFVNGVPTLTFDAAGKVDFQWYKDRTGFLLVRGS